MFPVHKILKKLKDDRTVNSSNIVEKIKEEFCKKIDDVKYKEEYAAWEKNKFSIDHPFSTNKSFTCENFFLKNPSYKASLLFIAFMKNDLNIVYHLKNAGANVSARDNRCGHTPLHIAVMKGDWNVAKWLLAKGAKVNMKSRYGFTPLHCMLAFSFDSCNEDMLLTMLEYGADPWNTSGFIMCVQLLYYVVTVWFSEVYNMSEVYNISQVCDIVHFFRCLCASPVDMYCFLLKEDQKYRCEKGDSQLFHWIPVEVSDKYRFSPEYHPKYFLKLSDANNKAQRFVRNPALLLGSIGAVILFKTDKITLNALNITTAVIVVISVAIVTHYAAYEVLKPSFKLARARLQNFIAKQYSHTPILYKQLDYEITALK